MQPRGTCTTSSGLWQATTRRNEKPPRWRSRMRTLLPPPSFLPDFPS
ncbi:MAG: hypothetical protein F4Y00_03775 [Bacteroidetes bacterium SB0662_bin_6]|nr:hypothetical protein [Bacteroidetes bacterium SB0668_bin_1]MYE04073.1 hypothetical protein [Bacteroidetes bacterium SB0662_bin_6]